MADDQSSFDASGKNAVINFEHPLNAMTLRGMILMGGRARNPFILGVTVNAGGTTATFVESGLAANTMDVYHIEITDEEGNLAEGNVNFTTRTSGAISTSGLNPNSPWQVFVRLNTTATNSAEQYTEHIAIPKSYSQSWDNSNLLGTPSIAVDGTTVADAGSIALPSASVGDIVDVQISISDTGDGDLQFVSMAVTGDGTFQSAGVTPAILPKNNTSNAWVVRMDTSAAASVAADVTLTTTNSTNVSYVVTINLTVA